MYYDELDLNTLLEDLYEKYFNTYTGYKLLNKGSNMFEEYELVCESDVYTLINKQNLEDSKIIYKIKGIEAEVVLDNGVNNKVIGKCKAYKIVNNKKKSSWWKRLLKK